MASYEHSSGRASSETDSMLPVVKIFISEFIKEGPDFNPAPISPRLHRGARSKDDRTGLLQIQRNSNDKSQDDGAGVL